MIALLIVLYAGGVLGALGQNLLNPIASSHWESLSVSLVWPLAWVLLACDIVQSWVIDRRNKAYLAEQAGRASSGGPE